MPTPLSCPLYPKSKLLILALLSINAVTYAIVDTLTTAIDALTWLILLLIYELETHSNQLPITEKTLERARSALIVVIVWVFFSYFKESEWLDVANSLLWFALIALMELEVRRPDIVIRHTTVCWILTVGIFTGLLAMAGVWLWQQAWLDAYDALLWITAFGLIEADLVQLLKRKQPAANANG
ncbi:hypothetical protein [Methylomonas methanica]|uniref:Uncharacterized protein n=1 Tax=Methylomonas methanica (strain DSM 25384 / MC09) TaxID=857087 RepID=G0A2I8_METMM|nr:hypothetical protein [Methylomonas methanica]AEG00168.1 hypothetical protein Metme_1750 [Methylomonas methanica MC09]